MTGERPCPCGLGEPYDDCCGRLHRGEAAAPTAELLMRSRFSAFAVRDEPYLLRTWHRSTRPRRVEFDPDQEWFRLDIVGKPRGGLLDADGTVEFRAHYRVGGRPGVQDEHSRFVRDGGAWQYVGAIAPTPHAR
jgi:SEC-C motif-containing protein